MTIAGLCRSVPRQSLHGILLCLVLLIGCDKASADFEAGRNLEKQGDVVAAVEAYKHAVANDPYSETGKMAARRLAFLAEVWCSELLGCAIWEPPLPLDDCIRDRQKGQHEEYWKHVCDR